MTDLKKSQTQARTSSGPTCSGKLAELQKKSSPSDGYPPQGLFEARRGRGFSRYFSPFFPPRGHPFGGGRRSSRDLRQRTENEGADPGQWTFSTDIQNQFFLRENPILKAPGNFLLKGYTPECDSSSIG